MVIKGIVQNGRIEIQRGSLPEGTQVLITPTKISDDLPGQTSAELTAFKQQVKRIASLPCESKLDDHFSGADQDRVLYGNQA
jgi:hypothetical protein